MNEINEPFNETNKPDWSGWISGVFFFAAVAIAAALYFTRPVRTQVWEKSDQNWTDLEKFRAE